MSNEQVTILLCTRNGMPWLPEQLRSIEAQEHRNWSIWVSDDGSTDNTCAYLEDYSAKNPGRISQIIEGPRRGSAANYLSLLCHPDLPDGITALCDQDDVWLPQKLSKAVSALRKHPSRPTAWSARYIFCDADLKRGSISSHWARPPSFENALVQNILSGHTLTLNAAALKLIRKAGMRDVPHHDWWIYLLLSGAAARIICEDTPLLLYRQHGNNTVGAQQGWRARLNRIFWIADGTYREWQERNLAALGAASELLTPHNRNTLDSWRAADCRSFSRLRRFGALRLHRQSRAETGLLALATIFARV